LAKHAAPSDRRRLVTLTLVVVVSVVAAGAVWFTTRDDGPGAEPIAVGATTTTSRDVTTTDDPTTSSTATTVGALAPYDGWVNPKLVGRPWSDTVDGLLTFRGGPTRSYYGKGPVPAAPKVLWSFPPGGGGMCAQSHDQHGERTWCGSGWTGEPAVWHGPDGRTWVAFGAYDRAVHWLDGDTGARILDDFPTGDIIKGSVTVDPDGFPLLYTGSRDNYYRVIAMDRGEKPVELWKLSADAVKPTLWNDDWDGSGLVIDDYLFEGGENSQWFIVKLNRAYGPDGKVTVNPQLVFHAPGWDDQLLHDIGDTDVSIENSVAISGNTVYFANSGGLVQGWDISGLKDGKSPTRVFRFWTGDDTDASIVIDDQGMLYVASEYERSTAQSRQNGQLMKLDPSKPDNPLVWSVADHDYNPGGIWSTPAIWKDVVYTTTNGGRMLAVDRMTGAILWQKQLAGPTWQSPVVVDDTLIEGDCNGVLHAYDVSNTRVDPPQKWAVTIGGCIESTPAVWNGHVYLGTRAGRFWALGDG
jgi:hypothetical protein